MREIVDGQLVILQAYQEADIDALLAAISVSIDLVSRYETWCHPGYQRKDAAAYVRWWRESWQRGQAYYFAVRARDSSLLLGSCGLSGLNQEHRRAGLGFWIRSDHTGQGYATDAARAALRFGYEDLNLDRIELEIAVQNGASRRVAEKLGCTLEGTLRHRLVLPSGPTDTAMYALLRADFPTINPKAPASGK